MENEDQMLALDNYQGQDLIPNVDVPVEEGNTKEVNAEVVQHIYPSPFNSSVGKSSVDLSIADNEQVMTEEYNNWWNTGRRGLFAPEPAQELLDERSKLRDEWYQKYYGMSYEDYESKRPRTTMYGYTADLRNC